MKTSSQGQGRYRVGAAARLAGVSPNTLRVWERRHGPFASVRSPGGNRLYTDADVDRVRALKRLADAGQAIGTVAALPPSELLRVERRHQQLDPLPAGAVAKFAAQRLAEAARAMDLDAFEGFLNKAAVAVGPVELVENVLGPVLREVGSAWAAGTISVAHEHAVSNVARTVLGTLLRTERRGSAGPPVVAGTPEGEQHELGALGAALIAAASGFRAVYLGASVPAADFAEAVRTSSARAVLVSCISLRRSGHALAGLRGALPADVVLIAGGTAAPRATPGVVVCGLDELGERLRAAVGAR